MSVFRQLLVMIAGAMLLANIGCRQAARQNGLVLVQTPVAATQPAADMLDARYPNGSRVLFMDQTADPKTEMVLSQGLVAAGDPVVSYDGCAVYFVGKETPESDWQIYRGNLSGDLPKPVTSMPGGAMHPALLPTGSLVFISPVPKMHPGQPQNRLPAIYLRAANGSPSQLSFGARAVSDLTILADGRILFVQAPSNEAGSASAGPALFTINSDGTEITAFAGALTAGSRIEHPRLLADGRVAFIHAASNDLSTRGVAECVSLSRPFQSLAPLFSGELALVSSVEPALGTNLLICAANTADSSHRLALFQVEPAATVLAKPILTDPQWNICEAVEAVARPRPMGRLSTMDPQKQTGKILCLNANFSGDQSMGGQSLATHVRLTARTASGTTVVLGEAPVQADGSFLAEVPTDVPLGFETLDANNHVLHRQPPVIWLRPAENRSCIGCHEPPNRAPHNARPLALNFPITSLNLPAGTTPP